MKILEKLFCGHKWKVHAKTQYIKRGLYVDTNSYRYTQEVLICEKCGKIKKVEY